jgi:hypothetical protein
MEHIWATKDGKWIPYEADINTTTPCICKICGQEFTPTLVFSSESEMRRYYFSEIDENGHVHVEIGGEIQI